MSAPDIFEPRPDPVHAMHLAPGTDNWKDVCDWLHPLGLNPSHLDEGNVQFDGKYSGLQAWPDDWVIRDGSGEFHVMGDSEFVSRYQEADDETDETERPSVAGQLRAEGFHLAAALEGEATDDVKGEPCCGHSIYAHDQADGCTVTDCLCVGVGWFEADPHQCPTCGDDLHMRGQRGPVVLHNSTDRPWCPAPVISPSTAPASGVRRVAQAVASGGYSEIDRIATDEGVT